MTRPLIAKALELASTTIKTGDVPKIVIEAPTGYGKSIGAPLFFKVFKEYGLAESFLHVLPLRAIVRDIYICTILNSLGVISPELCGNRAPPIQIGETLRELGLRTIDIAYQMGDLTIGEFIVKNVLNKQPLFDAKYVVTTIDSFLYNLFRAPITELMSVKKHYAIPRLRIFISAVYLDEAHIVFEEGTEGGKDEESSNIYTAAVKAFKVLNAFKTPLIMASATMGKAVLEEILRESDGKVKIVRLGPRDETKDSIIEISDREFVDRVMSVNWHTKLVKNEEVADIAKEHVETGLKVLIVKDSVSEAIETYKKLKNRVHEKNVVLIHGKMIRGDRENALNIIKKMNNPGIVISTSVIEAGVNVSFDVLITDGLRPRSVVQRAGRVCRDNECEDALIYIIENRSDEKLREFIKNNRICWRIPFDVQDYKGYGQLLDSLKGPNLNRKLMSELEALVEPLFVSSGKIEKILENWSYALVRVGIIDVIVEDSISEIERWSYGELIARGLSAPVSLVEELLKRGCVTGVVAIWVNGDIERVEEVCDVNKLLSGRGFDVKKFIECSRETHRRHFGDPPTLIAVMAKKSCYESWIGFRV